MYVSLFCDNGGACLAVFCCFDVGNGQATTAGTTTTMYIDPKGYCSVSSFELIPELAAQASKRSGRRRLNSEDSADSKAVVTPKSHVSRREPESESETESEEDSHPRHRRSKKKAHLVTEKASSHQKKAPTRHEKSSKRKDKEREPPEARGDEEEHTFSRF